MTLVILNRYVVIIGRYAPCTCATLDTPCPRHADRCAACLRLLALK